MLWTLIGCRRLVKRKTVGGPPNLWLGWQWWKVLVTEIVDGGERACVGKMMSLTWWYGSKVQLGIHVEMFLIQMRFLLLVTSIYWLARTMNISSPRTRYYIPGVMAPWSYFLLHYTLWKLLCNENLISFIYILGRQHIVVVKSEKNDFGARSCQVTLFSQVIYLLWDSFCPLLNWENCLGSECYW